MKPEAVAGWVFFAAVTVAPAAQAKFITIETSVNARIEGDTAVLLVGIMNKGDEPAHNLRIRAEVGGQEKSGLLRDTLVANDQYSESLSVTIEPTKPGRYPVIVTVDYTDGNQYPFTATSIIELTYQEGAVGKIVGEIAPLSISRSGSLNVTVKNMGQTEENLGVRVVTPHEISVATPRKELTLKPGKERSLTFKVNNVSALPGSQYQIYAILNYENDLLYFTNVLGGSIAVETRKDALESYANPLIAGTVLLAAIFVYVNLKKRSQVKGRPT